jgi:ABC-type sugar transport system substrate-binding protein
MCKNTILFKTKGAILRDKGTLADNSKKIELFLSELNDEQVVALNKLVKMKEVDLIIINAGDLSLIESVLKEAREIASIPEIQDESTD